MAKGTRSYVDWYVDWFLGFGPKIFSVLLVITATLLALGIFVKVTQRQGSYAKAESLEAEDASVLTGPVIVNAEPLASNGKYIEFVKVVPKKTKGTTPETNPTTTTCFTGVDTSMGLLATTTEIRTTGTFRLWSRMMSQGANSNSYWVQVDDQCPILIGDNDTMVPKVWHWVDYRGGDINNKISITLTAGIHSLKLIGKESGLRLDRILLVSRQDCSPVAIGDNCL